MHTKRPRTAILACTLTAALISCSAEAARLEATSPSLGAELGAVAECASDSASNVVETLDWSRPGGQVLFDLDDSVRSSRITTTGSATWSGNVTVVPGTGTGYASRQTWISSCPGGTPELHEYDGCFSSGGENSVRWAQGPVESRMTCVLERHRTYYLNHRTVGCTPGANCPVFRNIYTGGDP